MSRLIQQMARMRYLLLLLTSGNAHLSTHGTRRLLYVN
jgi:hypothetical protein